MGERGSRWLEAKLRADPEKQGRLFRDWKFFIEQLKEAYGHRGVGYGALAKIWQLRMRSDQAGEATEYVENFRRLASRIRTDDQSLLFNLFRDGLTEKLREQFESFPPDNIWDWYEEVELIDQNRVLAEQGRHTEVVSTYRPTSTAWQNPQATAGRQQYSAPR